MDLALDRTSPLPLHDQIVAQVKGMIWTGRLEPGSRLEPLKELSKRHKINYNTLAAAFRALEVEGYLHSRRGGGTRVVAEPPKPPADLLAMTLGAEFRARLDALGVAPSSAFAHTGTVPLRPRPLVGVLARTPLAASRASRRSRAILGDEVECVPVVPGTYRSGDYHLTVMDPSMLDLLAATPVVATLTAATPNVIPSLESQVWTNGVEFPAGAD